MIARTGMKIGAILLTLWSAGNLLLAVGILFYMLVLGGLPPSLGLVFAADTLPQVDPRAIALVSALAVLFNAAAVALCTMALALIWKGIVRGQRWAYWAVLGSLLPLQVFGFVSDSYLGNDSLIINIGSTLALVTGLLLTGIELLRATDSQATAGE